MNQACEVAKVLSLGSNHLYQLQRLKVQAAVRPRAESFECRVPEEPRLGNEEKTPLLSKGGRAGMGRRY